MDLPTKFYLQTVHAVFVKHALPKREMKHRCAHVVLSTILCAGLSTVEDDVSLAGETYRINLRRMTPARRFTLRARATTQDVVLIMPARGRLSEERFRRPVRQLDRRKTPPAAGKNRFNQERSQVLLGHAKLTPGSRGASNGRGRGYFEKLSIFVIVLR